MALRILMVRNEEILRKRAKVQERITKKVSKEKASLV